MSTASTRGILRIPGRLCYGASLDLTAAFPHGGTAIGMCRDIVFHPGVKTLTDEAEEFGGVVTKAYFAGEKPFLSCVLRDFDNDWISTVFPNTSAGVVTGDRVISSKPGDDTENRAGTGITAIKLCVSPHSPNRHPFVVLMAAFPAVDETQELQFSLGEEVGLAGVFWAGVDTSGRDYFIGKGYDLNSLIA